MTLKLNLVFIGLSLSSSWGNGHATTFRALLRGLQALGHDCLFLERDVPWYAAHRDLPSPDFCMLSYYADPTELNTLFRQRIEKADAVIIGSYVPDGKQVIDTVREMTPSCLCFYDTANLLSIAASHGASFVQASTSEIYGDPEEHPQREDYRGNVNCTGPRACYDEGKRAAEALCFDMLRSGKVDARVARIFNTYGPHMRPDDGRIISNLLVQALKGEALTIYGHGNQTRSFCYVKDLVAGLIGLMEVQPNPSLPVNLGNPGEFTINELADLVLDFTRSDSKIVYKPLPVDDPQRRRPDISRAQALLGWEPTIPLREGLRMTSDWFAYALRGEQENLGPPRESAQCMEKAAAEL